MRLQGHNVSDWSRVKSTLFTRMQFLENIREVNMFQCKVAIDMTLNPEISSTQYQRICDTLDTYKRNALYQVFTDVEAHKKVNARATDAQILERVAKL